MLFIPESRKRPITESLLYKQIIRFFRDEGIEGYFDIVFISISNGVVEAKNSDEWDYGESKQKAGQPRAEKVKLPPKNFQSGRTWVNKEQIEQMSNSIVEYLKSYILNHKSEIKVIAYVRGSYLEATRLASKKSGIEIKEIFSNNELSQLKKKGIMWMKVGLRMPVAFIIFRMKIRHLVMEHNNQNKQLKLF